MFYAACAAAVLLSYETTPLNREHIVYSRGVTAPLIRPLVHTANRGDVPWISLLLVAGRFVQVSVPLQNIIPPWHGINWSTHQ